MNSSVLWELQEPFCGMELLQEPLCGRELLQIPFCRRELQEQFCSKGPTGTVLQ